MGVILGMFRELARLGVSRAAAFFYAVAVGVVANIVIAHFSPHDTGTSASIPPAEVKPITSPIATAVIAPKPAPATPPTVASAPATPPTPVPAVSTAPIATMSPSVTSPPTAAPPGRDPTASTTLPSTETLAPPPLKPTAVPTPPPADAPAKPAGTAQPTTEATATPPSPAALTEPISLLPTPTIPEPVESADLPVQKPAKPGPGSGGLY